MVLLLFDIIVWLILVTDVAVVLWAAAEDPRPRVYLGEEDKEHKYPYVITFIDDHNRYCSGTLIAPDWVLTAAHCEIDVKKHRIQYGNMTKHPEEATTVSQVRKAIPHPHLISDSEYFIAQNDLQMVHVQTTWIARYGNISGVDYQTLAGLAVEFGGYGASYMEDARNQETLYLEDQTRPLQLGHGIVVSCDLEETACAPVICVAARCSNRYQETRPGDSGSPVFHREKIIGVLHGGVSPINWYTPVSPYIDWIRDIMTS